MKAKLEEIRLEALHALEGLDELDKLEEFRLKYLGKKGALTQVLRGMGGLPAEERPIVGQIANEVRNQLESELEQKTKDLKEAALTRRLEAEKIDVTVPGERPGLGRLHPVTTVLNELKDIFLGMGFDVAEGPEIEYDYYNFEALNLPKNHPARDTQDTFYIDNTILLRTHTSPVQIRTMEKQKPPIKIICPGRVYRSDEVDATHSPIFHQIEGLVVDKGITMGDLKGVLDVFAKAVFGPETKTKLRPHHFPFTEPSAEVDVSCAICKGAGCRVCSYTGWIEILGAGMVHPRVLEYVNIDPNEYSGFAFGMGLDRIVNIKYGIDDIRLLFENDIRFLKQF
ncbi:MAG: phenylalanine--tRNA ligase subunit alpha [Caldicoprobacterales bacterium]|jgi:phenylalanyl-tRNA synthetase alpha chain|nr:phenylalanine--tRNA ligase subunit alpha [Clostridia bacterium]MDI9511730.1 phenylalanine--tRNA ligase subunit alpha [Bacillota bacterium]NLH57862.1 phenylalanine--tRNA ligase subunit alpha [Clostridiales bacterium]